MALTAMDGGVVWEKVLGAGRAVTIVLALVAPADHRRRRATHRSRFARAVRRRSVVQWPGDQRWEQLTVTSDTVRAVDDFAVVVAAGGVRDGGQQQGEGAAVQGARE